MNSSVTSFMSKTQGGSTAELTVQIPIGGTRHHNSKLADRACCLYMQVWSACLGATWAACVVPAATGSLIAPACCVCCLPAACTIVGRTHIPTALRAEQMSNPALCAERASISCTRPLPAHCFLSLKGQAWRTQPGLPLEPCVQSTYQLPAHIALSVCRSRARCTQIGLLVQPQGHMHLLKDLAGLFDRPGLLIVQEQVRNALLAPGMAQEEWQQPRDMAAQVRSADARLWLHCFVSCCRSVSTYMSIEQHERVCGMSVLDACSAL